MGHPLGELSIHRGILWISYEGGARSSWKDIVKWRFDETQKDFIRIGETYEITDNLGEFSKERIDINFCYANARPLHWKKPKTLPTRRFQKNNAVFV